MANPSDPPPQRFSSAAAHYLKGRPPYASILFEDVARLVRLDRTHRVMDLGCGPAQIAIAFAPLVFEVVAIDPEPAMLGIARQQAKAAGAAIRFVEGSSEDIDPALGLFRLVTIGRAFHWMDRVAVLRRLEALIERQGAVALFGEQFLDVPENLWRKPYDELLDGYAASDTTHPKHKAPDWWRNESVLLDSPFARLERIAVIERRHTPVETFVDRALSMSSTEPARLGDRAEEFGRAVTELMASHATRGLVTEVLETHALIARRP